MFAVVGGVVAWSGVSSAAHAPSGVRSSTPLCIGLERGTRSSAQAKSDGRGGGDHNKLGQLSFWTIIRGMRSSNSFHEFMRFVRAEHGDVVQLPSLWPVLPPIWMLMGKAANRQVYSDLDPSLEQVLQVRLAMLHARARCIL